MFGDMEQMFNPTHIPCGFSVKTLVQVIDGELKKVVYCVKCNWFTTIAPDASVTTLVAQEKGLGGE